MRRIQINPRKTIKWSEKRQFWCFEIRELWTIVVVANSPIYGHLLTVNSLFRFLLRKLSKSNRKWWCFTVHSRIWMAKKKKRRKNLLLESQLIFNLASNWHPFNWLKFVGIFLVIAINDSLKHTHFYRMARNFEFSKCF